MRVFIEAVFFTCYALDMNLGSKLATASAFVLVIVSIFDFETALELNFGDAIGISAFLSSLAYASTLALTEVILSVSLNSTLKSFGITSLLFSFDFVISVFEFRTLYILVALSLSLFLLFNNLCLGDSFDSSDTSIIMKRFRGSLAFFYYDSSV